MVRGVCVSVGETYTNNVGDIAEVVRVNSSKDVEIRFLDGNNYTTSVRASQLKRGSFKNLYTPSVRGVGFLGCGEYSRKADKDAYIAWQGVLQRCFDQKLKDKFPSYAKVTLDRRWNNFQNFCEWFYIETANKTSDDVWCVDKDVSRREIYGPDSCIIVPMEINNLFLTSKTRRGSLPVGVIQRPENGKYRAKCQDGSGVPRSLGEYDTIDEAFSAYKTFKQDRITQLVSRYSSELSQRAIRMLLAYTVLDTD